MTALLKPTGSPAERFTSRDPDDFPDPTGRRRTGGSRPSARIREFFEPFEPDGVIEGSRPCPRARTSRPSTRARSPRSARRSRRPTGRARWRWRMRRAGLHVRVDANAELDRADRADPHGRQRPVLHPPRRRGRRQRRARRWSSTTAGLIQVAANIEFVVGDGALAVGGRGQHAPTRARCSCRPTPRWSAATPPTGTSTSRSAARSCASSRPCASPARAASAELLGVSFAGDGQHFEGRLFVDHDAPNCTSNVLYKNALLGESARTVWIGDVRIRPAATGTETYEMNRNLLLSDGARADSVPNLEIETGDIAGAGHASATGRFDDLQLFYLQSRGIPEDEARRLVVRGFFADVVERIGVPELEQQIMTAIEARLGFTADWRTTEHEHAGDPRPARHRRRRRGHDRDPQGRRPDGVVGRDPRDHGPERVGQVDAGLLDRRPPEVHRHRRHGHPRRRRTCWP